MRVAPSTALLRAGSIVSGSEAIHTEIDDGPFATVVSGAFVDSEEPWAKAEARTVRARRIAIVFFIIFLLIKE